MYHFKAINWGYDLVESSKPCSWQGLSVRSGNGSNSELL